MSTNEFLKIQVLKEINTWVQNKTKKKILQIKKKKCCKLKVGTN